MGLKTTAHTRVAKVQTDNVCEMLCIRNARENTKPIKMGCQMDIGEELMVSPDAGFNSKTNGKIKTRLLRESLYITLVIDLVLEVLLKHHFLCFRVLENILHGDQVQVITIVPFLFLRDFVFHFPLFLIVLFFFFPLELIAG